MTKKNKTSTFVKCYYLLFPLLFVSFSNAQNMKLVWADEFDNAIDFSIWDYDLGPSNDNVHYYTNRNENLQIVDGVLNIVALNESYKDFDYTSALIKTKIHWRYGRIEARIKLPGTNGFVPAFWMLPADNRYGWWPNSGEIDIMEHPTNQVSTIYGTIHSETYNSFTGIGPKGGTVNIPDAETEFYVYAIEWDKDRIDFYVDEQLYFTFRNDHSGSANWPFDQPFYLILNLAVGGGWVGNPDENTVFPAIMEVDYVRVYQYMTDIGIHGDDFVTYYSSNRAYCVPEILDGEYSWEVPGNAGIVSGQNTDQITVDWNYFGGTILAHVTSEDETQIIEYPVRVSSDLLKNSGFEKGVKYWIKRVGYPAEADFDLVAADVPFGTSALRIDVKELTAYPWDVQLSQENMKLEAGQAYVLSFWAKSDNPEGEVKVSFINSDFYVYHSEAYSLNNDWTRYETEHTATTTDIVNINIDLGFQTGVYYFDHFLFTTPGLSGANQIENGDFFDGESFWNFITLSSAQAEDTVMNGELMVSITNGGAAAWDVHLGQSGLFFESQKEYTVSFDAYAETPRTISVIAGMAESPWSVYSGEQTFPLSTDKQTVTFSFIMNYPTDDQARFGFDIGGSTGTVYFDHIRVSSGTIPIGLSEIPAAPKSLQLFQNYPNPFNPETKITYVLPEASKVRIEVLNILGQHVATLVDGSKPGGVHTVTFNASKLSTGLYICTLETAGISLKHKMLFVK